MIPKCGEIVLWHWAHKSTLDCDPWYEGESQWHVDWKNRFPPEWQEVPIGDHRADILTDRGRVIELQHSPISPSEIQERERFYAQDGRTLLWVFDALQITEHFDLYAYDDFNDHCSFRWKWPRKSIWACRAPVYLDFSYAMFRIRKVYHNIPCGGWGIIGDHNKFVRHFCTTNYNHQPGIRF